MKYFIISDIHGSSTFLEEALDLYKKSTADYLVILGDILYHGPRNPLPEGYNPNECAKMLNELKDQIISVRGNCDSEVDQMVLDFLILESNIIIHNGKKVLLTHGHIHESHKSLVAGDILIHGHTHVIRDEIIDGVRYLNPGSISIPKGGNSRSYAILDESFTVYDFDGNIIKGA